MARSSSGAQNSKSPVSTERHAADAYHRQGKSPVPLDRAVLAASILALGFVQLPDTKVDVFPEFAPPQVEIQTIALGNSSNEVEELITVPIEDQLNGIEGLAELRSKSVAQLSSIRLIFEPEPTS